MLKVAGIIMACGLSVSAQAQNQRWEPFIIDGSGADMPKDRRENALKAVAFSLRDPLSAQFAAVRAPHPSGQVVCGAVNMKNAFGGYVGFRRFIVNAASGDIVFEADKPLKTGNNDQDELAMIMYYNDALAFLKRYTSDCFSEDEKSRNK